LTLQDQSSHRNCYLPTSVKVARHRDERNEPKDRRTPSALISMAKAEPIFDNARDTLERTDEIDAWFE